MIKRPLCSDKKRTDFLEEIGFEQTYESEPKISMGMLVAMEKWELYTPFNKYHLYIHFDETESGYCNLYYGESHDAEVFSYRNLISEIKKRKLKGE